MKNLYKNSVLSLSVLAMVAVFGCKKDPECMPSNPDLADPIAQGKADGIAFRDSEIEAGTVAGSVPVAPGKPGLTKEDGRYDGRAELYAATYNTAYQAKYNEQYIVGTAAGNQNAQSIADGAAAGTAAGGVDGCAQAKKLGYKQGCNEGKAIGQYAAQNGAIDCQWLAGSFKKERPVTQADKDRCYKNAYDSIVGSDPSKWRRDAFEKAKTNNLEYQAGFNEGKDPNRADNQPTITQATADGSAAGGPKGYNDGYAHGKQQAYNTSYTSAYNTAYNTNLSNVNCIDEGRGILPMIATDGSHTLVGGSAGRLDGYIYGAKLGCGINAGTSPCPQ